jgi:hypothetical protein
VALGACVAVGAAQRHSLSPRRLPAAEQAVSDLCLGIIGSAERVRQHAHVPFPQAAWSPYLTAGFFTQAATSADVIIHHCHILLQVLFRSRLPARAGSPSAATRRLPPRSPPALGPPG